MCQYCSAFSKEQAALSYGVALHMPGIDRRDRVPTVTGKRVWANSFLVGVTLVTTPILDL
jgi:hypothetical protein